MDPNQGHFGINNTLKICYVESKARAIIWSDLMVGDLIKDCIYRRHYIKVQEFRGSLPVNSLKIIELSSESTSPEIRFS